MPTGNLPASGKALWEKVYESAKTSSTCKDTGDRKDECAARVAWTAVKNAGWKKDASGNWHKAADLEEFSLTIKKASFDNFQRMRWKADTSDIGDDSYGDNMTLELFEDFVSRIKKNELAPEPFRSDFWQGGMPYLSVSHYPDMNGKAVPGGVESVWVDGTYLKAAGEFSDTPLGRACFKAAHKSIHSDDEDDKVRISIAFLDWMHKHKSNDYVFERKDLSDFCPECLKELINGEYKGRTFLKGQLVHLAQTKVPVNKRTEITAEVDRAMAKTRKEDAASIVGEELAEQLEEESKLVGKSEVLVIKAEDDIQSATNTSANVVIQVAEHGKDMPPNKHAEDEEYPDCKDEKTGEMDQDCVKMHQQKKSEAVDEPELVMEAVLKKEGGCGHPSSHFLVVEESDKPTTWHLRYKNCSGEVDNRLLGAAKAALTSPGGHRGNKYEGPGKESATSKLKGLYKKQGLDWESKSEAEFESEMYNTMLDIRAMLTPKELPVHPLDTAIQKLKADYDATVAMETSSDEKLHSLQPALNEFAQAMVGTVKSTVPENKSTQQPDLAELIAKALTPLAQKVELLSQQLSQQAVVPQQIVVPQSRAINPALVQQSVATGVAKSTTPKLRALIEQTT